MRRPTDLDCPTYIRNGLDAQRWSRCDPGGLVWRSRFRMLFVEFVRRAASGDIYWR